MRNQENIKYKNILNNFQAFFYYRKVWHAIGKKINT